MTMRQSDGSKAADGRHTLPGWPTNIVIPDLQKIISAGTDDFRAAKHDVVATFLDWSKLHGFDPGAISDCLAALDSNGSLFDLAELQGQEGRDDLPHFRLEIGQLTTALHAFVSPALAVLFDSCDLAPLIAAIEWGTIDDVEMVRPHTVDHGVNRAPEIRMAWRGSTSDLMCLAHEVAHAVQLQLSAGSFMPPVARETCAFLGELALIDWVRKNDPDLASKLLSVWREENAKYFGTDCELLRSALADPERHYSYQMNYPLARAAAVVMWRSGADFQRLFEAGSEAMALLPLSKIADLAGQSQNYLPPLPAPDTTQPAIEAYRALGAMTLLDIDFWKGESEQRIEDYYATMLHHMQNRTAFITLDEVRRPVGYATWREADGDNTVTLTRQAAPFGDHLLLQKALERHLGQESDVHAQHPRSARQEQMAW
jgi:hypothetical protein